MGTKQLLSAGYDGKVLLWSNDLTDSKIVISAPKSHFTTMVVHREKSTIYLGTLNSTVISYSIPTGDTKSAKMEKLHLSDKLEISESLNSLFVSGQSLIVNELDLDSLSIKQSIPGSIDNQITDFSITGDGKKIISTSSSASMIIRSVQNQEITYRDNALLILPGFSNYPAATSVVVDDENDLILVGTSNPPLVNAFSLASLDTHRTCELPNSKSMNRAPITEIRPMSELKKALCGDSRGNLFYTDYETDKVTDFWQTQESAVTAISELTYDIFSVGYRNGIIEVYETASSEPVHSRKCHDGPVVGLSHGIPHDTPIMKVDLEEECHEHSTSECRNCSQSIERLFWLCPVCQKRSKLYRWDSRKRFS